MMNKCVNCGAGISSDDIKCPYCGAMQYDAAEKQYMEKLYTLEEGMDKLDDDAKVYVFKDTIKIVIITLVAAAAAIFIGITSGYVRYNQTYGPTDADEKAINEMDWYDENIDYIKECYKSQDFASIKEKLNADSAFGSHRALRNWEHYPVCVIYSDTYSNFEKTQPGSSGILTEYEFTTKYRAAVNTIAIKIVKNSSFAQRYIQCTEYDKELADGWISESETFMEEAVGLTRKQYEADVKDMYAGSSYSDYDKVREYAKKYYQMYTDNLNGGTR